MANEAASPAIVESCDASERTLQHQLEKTAASRGVGE
jgi:hypothetical protein